jgi:hypothetical protein
MKSKRIMVATGGLQKSRTPVKFGRRAELSPGMLKSLNFPGFKVPGIEIFNHYYG